MIFLHVTLLVLTAALLLGAVWWWRRRAIPAKEIEWGDVQAEAAKGGYRLFTTDELARRYQRDPQSLLLVDTRPEAEYRAGHIKGAVNFALTPSWWGRWRSRRLLATILGPDKERLVVFY